MGIIHSARISRRRKLARTREGAPQEGCNRDAKTRGYASACECDRSVECIAAQALRRQSVVAADASAGYPLFLRGRSAKPSAMPAATTAAWTRKLTLNPCTSTPSALLEETDMTVMSTDAEIDPMIWRNELMIAVPCGRSSGGRACNA